MSSSPHHNHACCLVICTYGFGCICTSPCRPLWPVRRRGATRKATCLGPPMQGINLSTIRRQLEPCTRPSQGVTLLSCKPLCAGPMTIPFACSPSQTLMAPSYPCPRAPLVHTQHPVRQTPQASLSGVVYCPEPGLHRMIGQVAAVATTVICFVASMLLLVRLPCLAASRMGSLTDTWLGRLPVENCKASAAAARCCQCLLAPSPSTPSPVALGSCVGMSACTASKHVCACGRRLALPIGFCHRLWKCSTAWQMSRITRHAQQSYRHASSRSGEPEGVGPNRTCHAPHMTKKWMACGK